MGKKYNDLLKDYANLNRAYAELLKSHENLESFIQWLNDCSVQYQLQKKNPRASGDFLMLKLYSFRTIYSSGSSSEAEGSSCSISRMISRVKFRVYSTALLAVSMSLSVAIKLSSPGYLVVK